MAVLTLNAQATASTGAPSNFISAWPQHWNQIESQVKQLQVRIAKATREGRWGMVFGRSDPLPMQSHIASMRWRNVVRCIGYLKVTFAAASTISVTIPRQDYDLTPLGIEAAERAAPLADWIEMNMHNILETRRLRQTQHVG
jgi:hypothetical protein